QNLHICKGLCDLEYIDYVINSPANFGGGKKLEIIAKQLFPQKFLANKSFSRRKLSKSELQEFKRALKAEATWPLRQSY
ncbi:17572_t:CDS:2, partial [Entrophospora sp. SA101]